MITAKEARKTTRKVIEDTDIQKELTAIQSYIMFSIKHARSYCRFNEIYSGKVINYLRSAGYSVEYGWEDGVFGSDYMIIRW